MGKDQTVPYGTDSRLDVFQAINCLATIIQSLRDARGHHPDTPTRRYADTPIRRYADTPIRRYADTPIRRYADTNPGLPH
jgi:hypothetical protein